MTEYFVHLKYILKNNSGYTIILNSIIYNSVVYYACSKLCYIKDV